MADYTHRVRCITEDTLIFVTNSSPDKLIECPNNASHEIDEDSNVIVKSSTTPIVEENDQADDVVTEPKSRITYITKDPILPGKYELSWYSELNTSKNNVGFNARIKNYTDNEVYGEIHGPSENKNNWVTFNGFKLIEITEETASKTFKLDYWIDHETAMVSIRRARIKFWRFDDGE